MPFPERKEKHEIKVDGNLNSSNCVVESRFALKVTDFELHSLRDKGGKNGVQNPLL